MSKESTFTAQPEKVTRNPRIVASDSISGAFALPMGLSLFKKHERVSGVCVSTVCLEDGHLEGPPGWCAPEHGYETMVFLDGCSLFSVFTAKYETREEAELGHRSVITRLLAGDLPLAIALPVYFAWDAEPATPAGRQT